MKPTKIPFKWIVITKVIAYTLFVVTWVAIGANIFVDANLWHFAWFGVANIALCEYYRPNRYFGGVLHWLLHLDYVEEIRNVDN